MDKLENFYETFRDKIIGHNQHFETPFGPKKIVYADWIASGRLYKPIEEKIDRLKSLEKWFITIRPCQVLG